MKKKILLTKKYFENDIDYLKKNLHPDCEIVIPDSYDEQALINKCSDVNALLGGFISDELLIAAKKLELIQIPWTGVDKFNFDALKHTDAEVCNSHSNSLAVAEFAVALFLSNVKTIPYHDAQLRSGNWNRPLGDNSNAVSPFSPMISSMKIGIMGFGAIGKKIQSLLKSFGARFVVYTASDVENSTEIGIEKVYNPSELKEFLSACDAVFVSLPLTDKTNSLLDKENLASLKKGSYVINVSRGEIINEKDFYEFVSNGHINAAIDTWWKPATVANSSPSDYDYHELNNIIMSPHRAGMIKDDLPHLADAVTNLNNLCSGLPFINKLNVHNKY